MTDLLDLRGGDGVVGVPLPSPDRCAHCGSTDQVRMTCYVSTRVGVDGGSLGNLVEPRCVDCRRTSDPVGASLGWYP